MSGADYQHAMFQRTDLFRHVQCCSSGADYLVTPTLSRTALPIDQDLFEPIEIDGVEVGDLRRNWFPYTMPFNITGHPAITVRCGFGATACRSACSSSAASATRPIAACRRAVRGIDTAGKLACLNL